VHRDDRGWHHPVAQLAEGVRGDDVVRPDHRAPGRVVDDPGQAQPRGRVDDREVHAELGQALVEQARHHGRGAIERVLRLAAPEGRLGDAPAPALGDRHAQRVGGRLQRGEEPVGREVAAELAHALGEDGIELDPVAVPVDHRMVEARSDLLGRLMAVGAHGPVLPAASGWVALGLLVGGLFDAGSLPQRIAPGAGRRAPRRGNVHG
jgi:hypothetical protein